MQTFKSQPVNTLAITIVTLVVGAAALLVGIHTPVAFETGTMTYDKLLDQLLFMSVIAIFVERSNETYLIISGHHDDRVIDELTNTEYRFVPLGPVALAAGAIISAPLALAGIRVLQPVLPYENHFLLAAVDIVLTTGLLAGGSTLMHSIINLIPTLTGRVNALISGVPASQKSSLRKVIVPTREALDEQRNVIVTRSLTASLAPQHTIRIERKTENSGTLHLKNATTNAQFPVVWDRENRISPATLVRCSRTTMATKQRPGIHMPGAMLHGKPNNNIFIHRGRGESWSDGCFILDDDDMLALLAAIPEVDAFNITVEIT